MSFFTPDEIDRLKRTTVRLGMLYEFHFKSETVRRWSGNTTFDAAGHEWLPTFGAVSTDGLGWSGEPVSQQVTLSLSGVDPVVLGMVLAETEEADQQPLIIYLQLFDDDWQSVGGIIPIFYGLMQPPKVSRSQMTMDGGATQTISLAAENMFYNRSRPPNGRYTSLDQNRRTSTPDKIFDFVPSLSNKLFVYPDF